MLDRAPAHVVLRFDEAVTTVPGSLRVFDADVRRVDDGAVERPSGDSVSVGLPRDLPDGTYAVAWRVVSADSHPIRGAFAFTVGEPVAGGEAADLVRAVLDREAESEGVDAALAVVRYVGLSLILLCVGGAAALAFVADPGRLRGNAHWLVLALAGALLALDSLAWIALTGVKAAGLGLGDVFRWSVSREVVETGFGQVWIARALLASALAALALAAALRARVRTEPLLFLASALAVTPALSGHARVEGGVAIVSDAVHVLAAGIWAGGLAFLGLLLVEAGAARWSLAAEIVPRFSTLALGSVVALAGSGIINGFLEVRTWGALWDTTYGRLLLVKVALLAPLVALGAFNNRVSVPRLRSAASTVAARRGFVRAVSAELALVLVVVGVTAALVAEPPAKAAAAGPELVAREGDVGPYDYSVTFEPAQVGANVVHVYLLDSTGQLAAVDEISLAARLPDVDVGPLELELEPAGPGHATGVPGLPLPGSWLVELEVRKGDFDVWSTEFDVPIRRE